MSTHRSSSPGTGRITLVLFAAVAAATAYPWQSAHERWVLGVGLAVVAVALARWRGLAVTTILRRWTTIKRPQNGERRARRPVTDARVTALLAVAAPEEDPDLLPLPLIAGYLDRYGLRADAIRVTSRDVGDHSGARERTTWIGLTFAAVDNLTALQARSPRIPLDETAAVAARRLADHLREAGWSAALVDSDDIPRLGAGHSRETWQAVVQDGDDYLAAYQVRQGEDLPELLAKVWAYPTPETWTALEIAGAGDDPTVALATAFRTGAPPSAGGPLPGLSPRLGNHRASLAVLHPASVDRLDGHTAVDVQWLSRLRWPSTTVQHLAVDAAAG